MEKNEKPPQKILVVDDEPATRYLIQMILEGDKTIETKMAANGLEALDFMKRDLPDLLLVDVMMTGMTGLDLLRTLKKDERTKFLPVILLTSLDHLSDKVTGMEIGASDYITKPFNAEELLARVRAHLRIRALEKELAEKVELSATLKMAVALQHEINNPLSTIIGYLDLMEERSGMSEKERDDAYDSIRRSAERIADIVKRVSQISEVSATAYVGSEEMVDITGSTGDAGKAG